MSDVEFYRWMEAYKLRFLGPGEDDRFVHEWKLDIMRFNLEDALKAIADVARENSYAATKPRLHLALLIGYAGEYQSARHRVKKMEYIGEKPERDESWDRRMIALGVIDAKELKRRAKERGGK